MENGIINAEKFIEFWKIFDKKYIQKKGCVDPEKYNNSKEWTEFILGKKKTEYSFKKGNNDFESPLGKELLEHFDNKHEYFNYIKEDELFDLCIVSKETLENDKLISLHENETKQKKLKMEYYPKFYEVLIEHENDIYTSASQEMTKLSYQRAPLKVLITYNEDVEENKPDRYNYIMEQLALNFKVIVEHANFPERYFENIQTEYLLIIGQRNCDKINWYYYVCRLNALERGFVEEK